nr:molecular chaperone TorD family protein [Alsobacter ponti]
MSGPERRALAEDLLIFSGLHDREPDADTLAALREEGPDEWFSLSLSGPEWETARRHLREGLAAIPADPGSADLDDLAAEFAAIYLTFAYRAAPCESVWRDEDGLERQAPMFAVREWYRHHGLTVADWRNRPDDHLVNELLFLATLLREADGPNGLREAALFLRDHILVWVPAFTGRVAARCRLQFYAGVALATGVYLQRLAGLLGLCTGLDMTPPPLKDESRGGTDIGPSCGAPAVGARAGGPPPPL